MGDAAKLTIDVADGVSLPIDYVTKACAILAQRRKGKTYCASVIAEDLYACGMPWVALDPTGAWWGLRSSADGERAGIPVVVIGGQHGDLPLEAGAGAFIADLVLDHPGWYVVDLSLLEGRPAEREFATAFGQRLHRRKMQPGMDFPLHLFIDEADLFVPQEKETKSDVPLLAAYQGIVRRGGLHGLGVTLISQRPALVNKNALTQLDLLVLLRLVAGNDQDAVDKNYVSRFLTKETRAALMDSLATLPVGTAWFLEPGAEPPLVVRAEVRERRTFNSSATPKPGERRVEPRVLADVDIDAIRDRMAETLERAKQDDPAELRRQIAAAERKLLAERADFRELAEWADEVGRASDGPHVIDELLAVYRAGKSRVGFSCDVVDEALALRDAPGERVEVPVLDPVAFAAILDRGETLTRELEDWGTGLGNSLAEVADRVERASETRPALPARAAAPAPVRPVPRPVPPRVASGGASTNGDLKLKAGARRMLSALARLHPEPLTKIQLGTLADISTNSGTFSDYRSALRTAGLIDEDGGLVRLTAAGVDATVGELGRGAPTPRELKAMWETKLKAGARRMLDEVFEVYPDGLTRDQLSEQAAISRSSGTFSDYLSALRRNHLIGERDGLVYAGDALFLGGR